MPSGNLAPEPEFGLVTPEGVSCHYHRFKFTGAGADNEEVVARLKKAEDFVADAAALLCDVRPTVMAMAGTGVTFIDGYGHDQRLIKKMMERNGNLPTTTTSTSVITAFSKMGIRKVSIAMPYLEAVARAAVKFIEDSRIQVLNARWLNKTGFDIAEVTPETVYNLAMEVDRPESEAIFISCTNLHTFGVIDKLEYDLQKPVITSNQATIWNMLRMAGVNDSIEGYGQLLSKH
ncbi:Asp/Glu racemase [Chloroflexota bacterium]